MSQAEWLTFAGIAITGILSFTAIVMNWLTAKTRATNGRVNVIENREWHLERKLERERTQLDRLRRDVERLEASLQECERERRALLSENLELRRANP